MQRIRTVGGFPAPATIVQMYKKFGDALTAADIEGVPHKSLSEKLTGGEELSAEELLEAAAGLPGRPKRKAPTDSHNAPYKQFLYLKAQNGAPDMIEANKEAVATMSENEMMRMGVKPGHARKIRGRLSSLPQP